MQTILETPAPTPAQIDPAAWAAVEETTLPCGLVVPAFRVGRYLTAQGADGKAAVSADLPPWARINYREAIAAAAAAGMALISELQWLVIAHQIARQPENWTGGAVGEGAIYQGLRKWAVDSAQPGSYEPEDADERRWHVLANGEKVWDFAGNAFSWVRDDVQGDAEGLIAKPFEADSPSLTTAPHPSLQKGVGWRPDEGEDWSGNALIRGGFWGSGAYAGVFYLGSGWPDRRGGSVGFRSTLPGL